MTENSGYVETWRHQNQLSFERHRGSWSHGRDQFTGSDAEGHARYHLTGQRRSPPLGHHMPRWHERVVHRACGGGYEWGGSWSDDEPLDAVELDLTIEEGFFADHRQPPGSRIVHNGTGFAGGGKKDAEHVLFDPRLVINLEHYELSHAADPKTRDKRLAIEWLERHFDVSLEEYR